MVTFANVSLAGTKNLDSNEEAHIQNLFLDITRTPDNRSKAGSISIGLNSVSEGKIASQCYEC